MSIAEAAGRTTGPPLAPDPPNKVLGWLRRAASPEDGRRVWLEVALSVVVTVALGTWGFLELPVTPPLGFASSLYHALRLYALELGPAAEGAASPDWQLWVALVLAAALVARGLLALLRDHLTRSATRHFLSGHVIVCGAGVHGTRLTQTMSGDHDVVLIDVDAKSLGMNAPQGQFEWRLRGDCVLPETLAAAGVARAHWLVAMTGNDFINSQIVGTVRDLALNGRIRDRLHVLTQAEDPSLARFLEEEVADDRMRGARPVISPFSPNAIAAGALLEKSQVKVDDTGQSVGLMDAPGAPNLLLAGDHELIDAVVLAAVRRWSVRLLYELESSGEPARPAMHISVFGPGAVARVDRLRERWDPDPAVAMIEARDAPPVREASIEVDEWLLRPHRADHAIVCCEDELDGVGMTLGVSRALGDRVLMTRVTTGIESALDLHLERRTAASPHLATTDVKSIADLAHDPHELRCLAGPERLARALERSVDVDTALTESRSLFSRSGLRLHSAGSWRIRACERPWLEQLLHPVPLRAVVDAGLAVDLASTENLRTIADKLSARGSGAVAFAAWCEYARQLQDLSAAEPSVPVEAGRAARTLLALRRATLGDEQALDGLQPDGALLRGTAHVAIFAGAAGSMSPASGQALEHLLERALLGYDGVVLSGGTGVGVPGAVGRTAAKLGLRLIGYAPPGRADRNLYPAVRETADADDFSVLEPLAMWTEILRAGIPATSVRVIVCPGGTITTEELLLARALGARVGWLDISGELPTSLDDMLPLGSAGVLELPNDPMTVRAFLTSSQLPASLRDPVAKHLHNSYRRQQRRRKTAHDPAMAPWDDLLFTLRESNRAQADDIPNKLALIGKKLAQPGQKLQLNHDQVELLAEVEHGRWNIERLQAGWTLGSRQIGRSVSPWLRPWSDLDDDTRNYDREAVGAIAPALEQAGWGVEEL